MKLKFAELIAFSFWVMLLSSQSVTTVGAYNGAEQIAEETKEIEEPSLAEVAWDTISMVGNPHRISWHKIKTLLNKLQLRRSPPNLDFRGSSSNEADAVEEVKEAVEKSLGSSKSTAEGSARSAAEAVHVTAEKVKESMSNEESRSEL